MPNTYHGNLTVEAGHILARGEYKYLEVFRSITGARWNKAEKVWQYPAMPIIAQEMDRKFPPTFRRDSAFNELVVKANDLDAHQKVKQQDNLPDIPITKTPAWNHQKQAYWFAEPLQAALLAMDMGTGKSKVVIDLIQNRGHKKVLIFAPKTVVPVWPTQFERHCDVPYRIAALDSGRTDKRAEWAALTMRIHPNEDSVRVIVVNYEAARLGNLSTWILKQEWDLVVADESHKIKSHNGVQSKFVATVGKRATHRLALTGTPLPHSPLDAFGQFRFLSSGVYGTGWTLFRNKYAITGGYGGFEILGYRNQEDFNRRFYSIAYRVGKEVLDLPPFHHITRTCELPPTARKHYSELEHDFMTQVGEEIISADNALVKLLRLQQLTGGHLDHGVIHEAKAELLEEILEELEGDEQVVIFARFLDDLDVIHGVASKLVRGSVELSGRKNELAQWSSSTPILAVQIQSGGVGIDLTAARYCIYYSTGFSLGDYEQSLARVHRPGQTRATTYIHLVASRTVDEKVQKSLDEKKQVVESILQEGLGDTPSRWPLGAKGGMMATEGGMIGYSNENN